MDKITCRYDLRVEYNEGKVLEHDLEGKYCYAPQVSTRINELKSRIAELERFLKLNPMETMPDNTFVDVFDDFGFRYANSWIAENGIHYRNCDGEICDIKNPAGWMNPLIARNLS